MRELEREERIAGMIAILSDPLLALVEEGSGLAGASAGGRWLWFQRTILTVHRVAVRLLALN